MVEMNEVANIINNATSQSLLILDEVGRGTSTYDGLSIAWSLVEYISSVIKAKTLFATHYHELVKLEDEIDCIKNLTVLVEEKDGEISFLRKIVEGSTDRSYGIEVAKLAGINKGIINRANDILQTVEGKSTQLEIKFEDDYFKTIDFEKEKEDKLIEEILADIENLKVENLRPIDALTKLDTIVNSIKDIRRDSNE